MAPSTLRSVLAGAAVVALMVQPGSAASCSISPQAGCSADGDLLLLQTRGGLSRGVLAARDPRCEAQKCTGPYACLASDGTCYEGQAQVSCYDVMDGVWCGETPPEERCAAKSCIGPYACLWSDGICYPRVAREPCLAEGAKGAVWCGEPEETTAAPTSTTILDHTVAPSTTTVAANSCGAMDVKLFSGALTHRNLAGKGPDSGAENLRYARAGASQGRSFDLVVTADAGGFDYIRRSGFAEISLKTPSERTLTFAFEDSKTGEPVVVEDFQFMLFDVDRSPNTEERVLVEDAAEYSMDPEAELGVEASSERTLFVSRGVGWECDNPRDPFNLREVTCQEGDLEEHTVDQRKRAITLNFSARSSFSVRFEAVCKEGPCGPRNFLFAGLC